MQEHLGNKHGKANNAGGAQQDHEELGDAKPESSTKHTDMNESSLLAKKIKPNKEANRKSSIDSASVSGNKRAKGKVRSDNMHRGQCDEEEDNTGQWRACPQPSRRSGATEGYWEVEVFDNESGDGPTKGGAQHQSHSGQDRKEIITHNNKKGQSRPSRRLGMVTKTEELLQGHKSLVTKMGIRGAKAQGEAQDQDRSGRDNQDKTEPKQHESDCSTHCGEY